MSVVLYNVICHICNISELVTDVLYSYTIIVVLLNFQVFSPFKIPHDSVQ